MGDAPSQLWSNVMKIKTLTLLLLTSLFLLGTSSVFAQGFDPNIFKQNKVPVEQDFLDTIQIFAEASPSKVSAQDSFDIKVQGRVDSEMHIYSNTFQGEYAPEPTHIALASSDFQIEKKKSESKPLTLFDETFETKLKTHKNEFWMKQSFRFKADKKKTWKTGPKVLSGYLEFQVCNNRICSVPLQKEFTVEVMVTP